MAKEDDIEEAYRRGQALTSLLKWARNQAQSDVTNQRWVELGIASAFESKERRLAAVNQLFESLLGLAEHVKILDMAATFELASQSRLATRVGAARSAVKGGTKKHGLPAYTSRLIHDADDFSSLKAIAQLLENQIDRDLADQYKQICEARNNFAHGTNILASPKIDADLAREKLIEVLKAL